MVRAFKRALIRRPSDTQVTSLIQMRLCYAQDNHEDDEKVSTPRDLPQKATEWSLQWISTFLERICGPEYKRSQPQR